MHALIIVLSANFELAHKHKNIYLILQMQKESDKLTIKNLIQFLMFEYVWTYTCTNMQRIKLIRKVIYLQNEVFKIQHVRK